jgi:hypothetical protein
MKNITGHFINLEKAGAAKTHKRGQMANMPKEYANLKREISQIKWS